MRVCAVAPFPLDATLLTDARWQPHDLLRLRSLRAFDDEPAWVRDAFALAPFVVVRRAEAAPGFVAVGMRGSGRAERYGTWAAVEDIEAALKPDMLLALEPLAERRVLPAFAALAALRDESGCFGALTWGPTGSVGFELASGVPKVTASSDLDLSIRTPDKLSPDDARRILTDLNAHATRAGIRIDAQLETPAGGVALAEYAAGKPKVLARHARGPQLVADPWVLTHEDPHG
jgi:phosphoribosyl-dephospho-CoA transferase